jgi:hypothetical protein
MSGNLVCAVKIFMIICLYLVIRSLYSMSTAVCLIISPYMQVLVLE